MKFRASLVLVALASVGVLGVGAPAASAAPSGTQYFVATTNNPDGGLGTITAVGPINAVGHDVVVNDNQDRFVFPRGAVIVNHRRISDHSSFDPRTCTFAYTEHGSYSIPRGTGAYAQAHGSGTYNLQVLAHGCDENRPPNPFSLVLQASGPLALG